MGKLSMICIMAVLLGGSMFAQHGKGKGGNQGSTENNKETARKVFDDLWTGGRADLVGTLYESNAVIHIGNKEERLQEVVSEGKEMRAAFPDLVVRANRVSANGEFVEVAWTAHGTNRGRERGYPGKGKPAKTQGTSKFRFNTDGKIAEVWVEWNENDVRQQVSK